MATKTVTIPQALLAQRLLRLALAFVFIYAAISAYLTPSAWLIFIPSYVPTAVAQSSLDFFSVVQLVLAAWLLSGWRVRLGAIASGLLISALTLSNLSSFLVTFRDVGLALAAFALATL